jgi:hypothetical protein
MALIPTGPRTYTGTAGNVEMLSIDGEETTLIAHAEYPVGTDLPGTPGKSVTFTVLSGTNILRLSFVQPVPPGDEFDFDLMNPDASNVIDTPNLGGQAVLIADYTITA